MNRGARPPGLRAGSWLPIVLLLAATSRAEQIPAPTGTPQVPATARTPQVPATARASRFAADFEWIWDTTRTQLYDTLRVERFFTGANHAALAERADAAQSAGELAAVVNSFLDSLRLSHTRLFTPSDLEFYLLKSLPPAPDEDAPPVRHVGAQWGLVPGGHIVQAVWDGYPAARAGLRRGDRIIASPDHPFAPIESFRSGGSTRLEVARGDRTVHVEIAPILEPLNRSLLLATSNSVQHVHVDRWDIGYIHLWSGTSPSILREFTRIVTQDLGSVDGIVLDLRDGWGGAWHAYLDPFFADRSDYFTTTVLHRGQSSVYPPDPVAAHPWFRGPMVVLINEGTRSGKEAMAFQFKKSRRAVLVGSTTRGAFTGGQVYTRAEGGSQYVLYLAYNGLLLDGQLLEGVGVAPDLRVDDPVDNARDGDRQFERGLEVMRWLLAGR